MGRSSFLVNLEACTRLTIATGNFTIKWTPSQVFFDNILSSPMLPPCFDLSPPPPPQNYEEPPHVGNNLWETLGSIFYNVKNYKFCQRNHISKLIKKRYIDSISIYFYDQETSFHYLWRSGPLTTLKKVLLKFNECNPCITECINLSKPQDHEIMTPLPPVKGFLMDSSRGIPVFRIWWP